MVITGTNYFFFRSVLCYLFVKRAYFLTLHQGSRYASPFHGAVASGPGTPIRPITRLLSSEQSTLAHASTTQSRSVPLPPPLMLSLSHTRPERFVCKSIYPPSPPPGHEASLLYLCRVYWAAPTDSWSKNAELFHPFVNRSVYPHVFTDASVALRAPFTMVLSPTPIFLRSTCLSSLSD